MKQGIQNGMKLVNVNVDQTQVFVTINNAGMKINVGVKMLIDKGVCDKGFIWNPSNCECEYDKSCDVGEYLDYSNCKCMKKLFHKLVEECTENIDKIEIASEMSININIVLAQCTLCYFQ